MNNTIFDDVFRTMIDEAAADFVIKTDNRTAEEICLEINKRLKTVDN